MEFWGVKVPAGKAKPVLIGDGQLIHISQAALGFEDVESAKDVVVSVAPSNMKKIVLGKLSSNTPQIMLNHVLHRKSFLSHTWKDGCVHFSGYSADEGPSQSSPFQLAQPPQNAGAFGKFGQTQAAGLSGFGGPPGIIGQSNYGQSSVAQKAAVVQQAPASNPFGTLPVMPLMSIGCAGTSPSTQYGVSSLPTYNFSAETVLGKTEPLPEKEAVVRKRKKKTGENQPVEAPEEKTAKKTKKTAVDSVTRA